MITEGDLIEIATRRRTLEDYCEAADLYLATTLADHQRDRHKAEGLLDDLKKSRRGEYNATCEDIREHEAEEEHIEVTRDNIEKWLESCRDDMNRMADCIRKLGGER